MELHLFNNCIFTVISGVVFDCINSQSLFPFLLLLLNTLGVIHQKEYTHAPTRANVGFSGLRPRSGHEDGRS